MSPIRHLLVHLTEGARADTLLRLAGALADRHAAAITALAALPSPLRGALLSAEGAALAVQVAADEQQRLRAAAAARCAEAAARGTPAIALQCAEGDADVLLRAASRTADLLLVGQPAGDDPSGLEPAAAARLLTGAACPVLVLPHIAGNGAAPWPGGVPRRALVAWSGKREAARALRDALPLLAAGATEVEVVSFVARGDDSASASAELDEVRRHLKRHGIDAHGALLHGGDASIAERLRRGWIPDVPVAEALLSHAADLDADLLVMGAWGHARAWELVLGGVTRTMLQSMTLPVLMSH